ncbi:hypothetical protein D6C80_10194 [Aureobasidium pullulans]|nr:hypothetical protein D6C80_10194 [Aureobasidium pullulans]
MLQLPNELLFRIADFTCKADLPSLRATCKHLEQLTRKRFAAAYITPARSPASFTGLDQLDHIVSHSYSSAVIQGWMAVGDVPVHSGFEGFETPLRVIFQKMTQHASGLWILVSCFRPVLNKVTTVAMISGNITGQWTLGS